MKSKKTKKLIKFYIGLLGWVLVFALLAGIAVKSCVPSYRSDCFIDSNKMGPFWQCPEGRYY